MRDARGFLLTPELRQTYRGWLGEACKKLAVDSLVLVLRTALGTVVAGTTALLGISYAVSDKALPVWEVPGDVIGNIAAIVDGMNVLRLVAERCLASPTCIQ